MHTTRPDTALKGLAKSLNATLIAIGLAIAPIAAADDSRGGAATAEAKVTYSFMPVSAESRGCDGAGCGGYDSPRHGRLHMAHDYVLPPGQPVIASIDGTVASIGYPYAGNTDLMLVAIRSDDGRLVCRALYVRPTVKLGTQVKMGAVIGIAQNPALAHPGKKMLPHVHQDCSIDGKRIDVERDPRFLLVPYAGD